MSDTTTDRELLELAARAAGIRVCWHGEAVCARHMDRASSRIFWNPLADDGDALRLAAKLRIDLEWQNVGTFPTPEVEAYRREEEAEGAGYFCALEPENDYRRAIVRAAAELGKRITPTPLTAQDAK